MGLHHKDVLREILGLSRKKGFWRLIPKQIVEPKNGKTEIAPATPTYTSIFRKG